MDFCAIDFETANYSRASACSIGIVKVTASRIVDQYYSLINQANTVFIPDFIDIHGITAEKTAAAPAFDIIWKDVVIFIGGYPIAAHNIGFDISVLAAMLDKYKIDWHIPETLCSLKTARAVWPDLNSHSLDCISEFLDIRLSHHNALSDAQACALVLLEAEKHLAFE